MVKIQLKHLRDIYTLLYINLKKDKQCNYV